MFHMEVELDGIVEGEEGKRMEDVKVYEFWEEEEYEAAALRMLANYPEVDIVEAMHSDDGVVMKVFRREDLGLMEKTFIRRLQERRATS